MMLKFTIFMLFLLIAGACSKTEIPDPTISIFASTTDFGAITPKSNSALLISQLGEGNVSYTVTPDSPWIVLNKTAGTIKENKDTLLVSVDTTKLVNGINAAILKITPTLNGKIGMASGVVLKGSYTKISYVKGHELTADEVWEGNIFLTGDIVVPAGKTLCINAGTNVKIVGGRLPKGAYDGGAYGGVADIYVEGNLNMNGVSASPVNMYSSSSNNNWGRISFGKSGTGKIQYASINNVDFGIYLFASNTSARHLFKNIYFSNCLIGFIKEGANTVELRGVTFRDNNSNIAIYGIRSGDLPSKTSIINSEFTGLLSVYIDGTNNVVNITNSNFRIEDDFFVNIYISGSGSNNTVTADNCFGIQTYNNPDSSNKFIQSNIASSALSGIGCGFKPNLNIFSLPQKLQSWVPPSGLPPILNRSLKEKELFMLVNKKLIENRINLKND